MTVRTDIEEERDEARRGWADAIRRFATVTIALREHVEFWKAKTLEAERLMRVIRSTDNPYTAEVTAFLNSLFPPGLPKLDVTSPPQGPSSGSERCSHCGRRF